MLKTRIRRQAAEADRAVAQLAAIRRSVAALDNEDLLDLADIFGRGLPTLLGEMATAEMTKRNISL